MIRTGLHLKINLNTIPETNLTLFQRDILVQFFQQYNSYRGPTYWNGVPFDLKNKKQSVWFLLLIFINIFKVMVLIINCIVRLLNIILPCIFLITDFQKKQSK